MKRHGLNLPPSGEGARQIYSGKVRVEYVDQPEETFSAGDFFFVPPGHRPYMLEDTELLQITDKDEFSAFMKQLAGAGLVPPQ